MATNIYREIRPERSSYGRVQKMRALAATLLAIALAVAGYGVSIVPSATTGAEFLVARMCFIGAASAIAAAFCFWLVDNQRKATATLGAPIILGGITTISFVVSTYL